MSATRAVLAAYTATPDPSRWQSFLDPPVDAHEEDVSAATIQAARQQATPHRGPSHRGLKPRGVRDSRGSDKSFEQWADEVAWLVRLSPVMMIMLVKVASLATEWENIASDKGLLIDTTTAEMKEADCNLLGPAKRSG